MESTAKRTSTLGATKRKSSDMLDTANAVLKSLDEEERAAKMPKLSVPSTDMIAPNVDQKRNSVRRSTAQDSQLLTEFV